MPKVTDEHRLAKHDEILDAALRAFSRRGFQATSMAEIIAESGMSAGAIYGYFASKAEIVRAVATGVITARMADLEELGAQTPMPEPCEIVRSVIHGIVNSTSWPSIQTQVWGEAVTDPAMRAVCGEILAQIRSGFEGYLAGWQQQANGLNALEAARIAADQAPLFLSAVHGFIIQDSLQDDFDRAGYLERTLPYLPR
jgi:AcrR family transcriptional regulator